MKPHATPVPAPSCERAAQRVRLLLVDDEPAIRLGLRRFLTAKSYEVTEAEDCASAERACASSPPTWRCSTTACPTARAWRSSAACARSARA